MKRHLIAALLIACLVLSGSPVFAADMLNIRAKDEARENYRQGAEMRAAAERETAEKAEMDRVARRPQPVPYVSEPPPNAGSFSKQQDDPNWLNTEIARLNRVRNSSLSSGVNPEATDRQIIERKADLAKILSGDYVPLGKDGKPITWYKQQAENYAINQKTLESMQKQDLVRENLTKTFDQIGDVFKTFESGAGAELKASFISFIRSAGLGFKNTATANPEAVQELASAEGSLNALFNQLKELAPMSPDAFFHPMPEASLQPKTNRDLLSSMKGTNAYIMKFNKDYQDAVVKDKNLNKNLYSSWWMKQPENDAVKITKEFYATTPVRGELTRNTDWSGLTKGHQYVLDQSIDKTVKDPTVYVFDGLRNGNPIFSKVEE